MQYRVLNTTDVLINREPVGNGLAVERSLLIVRVGVAVEIPGRVNERVHGVGLAFRRSATFRTRGVQKFRHARER